jgi:hypothetical protein
VPFLVGAYALRRGFAHASEGSVVGAQVKLCPPEEMIWSKAYVMERERYDGADVVHLIRACGEHLDWVRLLRRFGALTRRLATQRENGAGLPDRLCRGTLLSRLQHRTALDRWGYRDGRVAPHGRMTTEQAAELDLES